MCLSTKFTRAGQSLKGHRFPCFALHKLGENRYLRGGNWLSRGLFILIGRDLEGPEEPRTGYSRRSDSLIRARRMGSSRTGGSRERRFLDTRVKPSESVF